MMGVRAGREFLAIPGLTTVPDEVSGPLLALTDSMMRDIARVFNTKGRAFNQQPITSTASNRNGVISNATKPHKALRQRRFWVFSPGISSAFICAAT